MKVKRSMTRWAGWGAALAALMLIAGPAQGSDVSGQATGHISNGSGNVESDVEVLDFQGTLKSRFRVDSIEPGTREAVAIAVAVCDGGTLSGNEAEILVPVAGAAPTIAGGLGAIPCIPSASTDGLATGFNGGVVTFQGPLAQYMGTTRIYADTNRNGTFFEAGELITQSVPVYNAGTNEAIVSFGRQGQMLTDGRANVVADTADRDPMVLLVTVDVDNNAPSGTVDAAFGLSVGDDTAQKGSGLCASRLGTNCGSNLTGNGPARDSFRVNAQDGGGTAPPPGGGGGGSVAQELRAYDANNNDRLDDAEFTTAINDWVNRQLSSNAFFAAIDLWINQSPISSAGMADNVARVQTRMGSRGIQFAARDALSLSVKVFSLDGSPVFSGTNSGATLNWNLRASDGAPVANGVYLYRTTLTTRDGRSVRGDVRKLVIAR